MDDFDYEDYLYKCGWFQHEAVTPPRKWHIGENVHAEQWRQLMLTKPDPYWYNAPNSYLASILSELPRRIRERDARVCASVIVWLGTNCGRCFIDSARRRVKDHREHPAAAFSAQWGVENVRHTGVNHGFRTIEHILAKPSDYGRRFMGLPGDGECVIRRPRISADDLECVDQLMTWLSRGGTGFLLKCETLTADLERFERDTRLDEHRRKLLASGIKLPG